MAKLTVKEIHERLMLYKLVRQVVEKQKEKKPTNPGCATVKVTVGEITSERVSEPVIASPQGAWRSPWFN